MVEINVFAKGTTGNVSGNVANADGLGSRVAVEFEVEAVGATPTVSWNVLGSMDGVNYFTLDLVAPDGTIAGSNAAVVATTVSKVIRFIDGLDKRWFSFIRITTSANTNVTFSARLYTPAASFS